MMRILILTNNDLGLYKFRKELIEKLATDYDVYICLPNGEYISKLKKIGCQYLECSVLNRRGMNPVQDIKLMVYYRRIIRKIKPSIVFTYTIKPNVYGGMACSRLKVPYVANITGLGTAIENGGLLQKLTLELYRFGLRKSKKVFFQNLENQDYILEHRVVKDISIPGIYIGVPAKMIESKNHWGTIPPE